MAVPLNFKNPFKGGSAYYIGPPTNRTANGSGTGSSTALKLRIVIRVGNASAGTGSSAVSQVLSRVLTASGNGTSSSSTVSIRVVLKTATGSGTGSASSTQLLTIIRTASGEGTGSSTTIGARAHFRTATGSGTGSEVSVHYKYHMFRPPIDLIGPQTLARRHPSDRLARHYKPTPVGRNVYWLTDLSFSETEQRLSSDYIKLFHGGHEHLLTEEEYTALVAAGYSANIT